MAWDDELFARIADRYDAIFASEVAQTDRQARFALTALGLRPGQRLLDVCCGPGRHSLALARLGGLLVTGVDREPELLAEARRRAGQTDGASVRFVQGDALRLPPLGPFDAAICMFASWGYAGDPQVDGQVLTAVARQLRAGARFLLDLPNLEWLRAHPRGANLSVAGGLAVREDRRFDPERQLLRTVWQVRATAGPSWGVDAEYRVYGVSEMEELLARAGMVLDAAYGDFDGEPLTVASPRCLLVSRRPVLPAANGRARRT